MDDLVKGIVVVGLLMFAGCGYWLYRENDVGGSWIPKFKDNVNERDLY